MMMVTSIQNLEMVHFLAKIELGDNHPICLRQKEVIEGCKAGVEYNREQGIIGEHEEQDDYMIGKEEAELFEKDTKIDDDILFG